MANHQKQWWLEVSYTSADGPKTDSFNCPDKTTAHVRFRAFCERDTALDVTLWQGSRRILAWSKPHQDAANARLA